MVARVEAQMSGRVREAEEAARVATARVQEAEESARAAQRVEEEAAARVESFSVICARVEAEAAVRVESLQARVNNKNGYRRKRCSQPQCQNVSRGIFGVCVRHGHILKKCNRKDATTEPKEKAFANFTEVVVSAWLMVVHWRSSKD